MKGVYTVADFSGHVGVSMVELVESLIMKFMSLLLITLLPITDEGSTHCSAESAGDMLLQISVVMKGR